MSIRNYFQEAFIMCPPVFTDNKEKINIWMEKYNEKINRKKIISQWLDVYNFVSSVCPVFLLPPKEGLQDQVYVSNAGVFLPNTNIFIVSKFLHYVRKSESKEIKEFVEKLGFVCIDSPYTFEGEAELKYLRNNIFFGGYGIRTDIRFHEWLSNKFGLKIIPIKTRNEYCYHLDCIIFPLNSSTVILSIPLVSKEEIKLIEKYAEIIPIEKEEDCIGGSTNCVLLNNSIVLNQKFNDSPEELSRIKRLEKILNKRGYRVVFFDFSEFSKSGAAISCCFLRINYLNLPAHL